MGEYEAHQADIICGAKNVLDEIVNLNGIDFIRSYLKAHNNTTRKKAIRVNNFLDVYYDVCELMRGCDSYSYTRAIDRISEYRNISESTVKAHYTKGKRYISTKEKEEAIETYQQAKKKEEAIENIDDSEIPF